MTNIILSWVIPIILDVGLVLFGFWMGNRAGKKNADWFLERKCDDKESDCDYLEKKCRELEDRLPKDYENVPVIYYFKSAERQEFEQLAAWNSQWGLSCALAQMARSNSPFGLIYADLSSPVYCGRPINEVLRHFKDIEKIEIKDLEQFCRTIALAIRDHGIKISVDAKKIKVYKLNPYPKQELPTIFEAECILEKKEPKKIDKPKKA